GRERGRGRVADAGVEDPADPWARVLARVVGGLADEPRERHQRRGGEDEQRDVTHMDDVVEHERERGQDKRPPKELPAHRATLAVALEAVLLRWGATLMEFRFD